MLRRLITRQLTFPNSPEATRFINSLTGSPLHRRRHHFPVKFLPSNYSFVKSKTSSASSAAVTRNRAAAADMDSTPMTASVTEDFVHVDSGTGNSNSEGLSESSVVKEQGVEEAISAIVEGEREGFERKVLPEELARSASSEEASVVEERGVEEAIAAIEGGEGEGYVRKELPEALLRSVMMLNCDSSTAGGVCDVYVVGTAHVSTESCQDVEAVINFLRPEVVFLELCSGRVGVLTPQNLKVPTMGEMVEMWKKNQNPFGILYSWFLAKVASKLEVFPGAEFRVAYEEAMKYGGKVILGDRPVQVTLRRTWAKMPLWHKTKLVYSLLFQAVFLPKPDDLVKMLKEMDDVDMLTLVIQEMSKKFPTLMDTLVHERDQFMSSMLLKIAREHNSVVAVVGKGHLPGIKKNWQQPIEVKELLSMPSPKPLISVAKIVATFGVAVAGVAIISGIYISSKK
ncbi:traB domain-containing protein [Capsicum annuum]|uniref:traB domain-containing protein n=1 Tax=Capsicum annuum TaxID=4072 RepID=UPI0007BF593C|nr:traB domain-containing protein [Capsicum annuum]